MAPKKVRPVPSTPEERIAAHHRQMLLQVWLPLAAGVLLFLAVGFLVILGALRGSSEIDRWGALSAIYVLIPTCFGSLLTMALLFFMVRGLGILHHRLPGWMYLAQAFFARISAQVRILADKIAAPVVTVGSVTEGLKAARRKISR